MIACVRVNEELSEEFKLEWDYNGCVISPCLFDMFMDGMLAHLVRVWV